MTRKLAISARQVTAICKGAAKASFVVELVINDMVVRLVPDRGATVPAERKNEAIESLEEWKTLQDLPPKVQRHYQNLGYDPATMNNSDYNRLYEEAEAKWLAGIPGTPLTKREQKVLLQFQEHGPGVLVEWRKIKGTGWETEERLVTRGFIEVRYRSRNPDRLEGYVLTEAGFAALEAILT
ncbi:MAG TPA: hypothetical protein VGX71_27610 [Pseudaminobacter sp.]|nr:hypothetical protein [Pseudaminobacter sp.]